MKALIVDDERLARTELKRLLQAHPEVEVIGEASSVGEALERAEALEPELMFLDIEMPDGTGFDLLEQLEHPPRVIFTTAYDAHAVRAFEVNALDYLLKPIEPAKLQRALERAHGAKPGAARPGPTGGLERLFVRDGDRCWLVSLRDVPLIESEGNYARLVLPDAQPMLARSLSYLEERLDPALFFRANRQCLLNLNFIGGVEPGPLGKLVVTLRGGREIELSRRQSILFRERWSP